MPPLPAFFLLLPLLAGVIPPAIAQSTPVLSLEPGGMLTQMEHVVMPAAVYSSAETVGVEAVTVSNDGELLFVTGSSVLSVWRVNAEAGTLSQTALYQDDAAMPGDFDYIEEVDGRFDGLRGAAGAAVNGDDKLLFVTARDALSVWRVNAEAGTLIQTALYQDDAAMPGDFDYIEEVDGRFDGLLGAESPALSNDDKLLFVTAFGDNALSVWRVNAEMGTLSQTALYRNGDLDDANETIGGLFGATGVVGSSDGNLLFVTGENHGTLSVWRVNAEEGTLSQTALYQDSQATSPTAAVDGRFDGLDGAFRAAVSGDGNLLFVTAFGDNALSVWQVNAEAGTLSQTALYRDGENRIDGLLGLDSVAVGGDGDLLFVTAFVDAALSVWQVNAEAGTLSQTALYRDGVAGVDGLDGAAGVAVNRYGDLLFVTAYEDDALSVWTINVRLPLEEPTVIRVQSDIAVVQEVVITVTARNGAGRAEAMQVVSLSPEKLSAEAIFPAGTLSPGRWIFTAQAQPPDVLDVSAARAAFGATVSGDGELLFVTAFSDDALSVWRVDKFSGTLSQTALYQDSQATSPITVVDGRFDGLGEATDAAVSGDGNLLFVTAFSDDALSVWRVDKFSGTLSQTALYQDSQATSPITVAANAVVSDDGNLLFVTACTQCLAGECRGGHS